MRTTKPLPLFINNRIKEVRSHDDVTFCYVPSKQNPADLPTRRLTVSAIVNSNLWCQRPEWLNTEIWPKWNIPELTPSRLEAVMDTERNQGGQALYEVGLRRYWHRFAISLDYR